MNLQTFKARTMADALTQVKTAMGGDAVILHTRTFQTRYWLGLRRREMVEITAGKGFNVGTRAKKPQLAPVAKPTGGLAVYSQHTNPVQNGKALLETPAANSAVIRGLTDDVTAMKTMLKDLVIQARTQKAPQVPEDLFDYYLQL